MNQTSKCFILLLMPTLFLMGCSQPPMKPVAGTEVATESGRVMGVTGDDRVIHWQDIPFAQPPEGALRWRAPQPYSNASSDIQSRENTICVQEAGAISDTDGDTFVGSEDCLYLDVVCLLYTSPSPRDRTRSRMPSSA